MKNKVVIIGAGLVGSLLSIFLSKRGYKVDVFDKRQDPHQISDEGRSINLAVSERAWNALRPLGLENSIKSIGLPMFGRKIHHSDSTIQFQKYTSDNNAIYSTSRSILNQRLIEEADKSPNTTFHFNKSCTKVSESQVVIGENKVDFDFCFGADGANSVVRKFINDQNTQVDFLDHEYIELHIEPIDGTWALDKDALHIWPRKSFMLIALPNPDFSFTCTLFAPKSGRDSFQNLNNIDELKLFCTKYFTDISPILSYPEEIRPSLLGTTKTNIWHKNKVCLIGDAAHAIVPFYGQGMNAGFEDCFILDQLLQEKNEFDFELFQTLRKENTDAIAELALQNFIEMRDLVDDPKFLKLKQLDNLLHKEFPKLWVPIYDQISFTNTPYKSALSNKKSQESVLNLINEKIDWQKKWSTPEINQMLTKYYKSL